MELRLPDPHSIAQHNNNHHVATAYLQPRLYTCESATPAILPYHRLSTQHPIRMQFPSIDSSFSLIYSFIFSYMAYHKQLHYSYHSSRVQPAFSWCCAGDQSHYFITKNPGIKYNHQHFKVHRKYKSLPMVTIHNNNNNVLTVLGNVCLISLYCFPLMPCFSTC